jgi:DNA-binding XRE family transcriptional regulator
VFLGDSFHNAVGESNDELQWNIWIAKNLGDLVAASSYSKLSVSKEKLARSLTTYAEVITQGNLAALARYLNIPKNTFWLWCKGKNQPTLEALVRICYCLQVPLLDFLT